MNHKALRGGRLLTVLALGAVLFSGCVARQTYDKAAGMIENQDAVIKSLQEENLLLASENQKLSQNQGMSAAELERLRNERDAHKHAVGELEARLSDLESYPATPIDDDSLPTGVSMSRTPEGVRFTITDTVLFDTGQTTIKNAGQTTLRSLVGRFDGAGRRIRIEGHSDNVPIVQPATLKKFPRGNLELSGRRALMVADFLIKNGLDPDLVSYAGYGEFKPVASNDTDAGRQKNRRVDILVIDQT